MIAKILPYKCFGSERVLCPICWTFYSSRNPEHNVFHFQINHNCF